MQSWLCLTRKSRLPTMLTSLLIILCFIADLLDAKSVAVNQTSLTLDPYYSADYKLLSLPSLFQTFSILNLESKSTPATKITVMVDGLRNIEVSSLTNIAFNDFTGSIFAAQSGRLYWGNFRNRNNFTDCAVNVETSAVPFVAGRWVGYTAAAGTPSNENFYVFDCAGNTSTTNFTLYKSDSSACSKITSKMCASSGGDKVYCLEEQSATKLVFLTYYSMPKCSKLKASGAVSTNFTSTDLVSLDVQGQLLSLCKTSTTNLSATCKVFDLNTSLFVLDNPDLSAPVKTTEYTLSLTIPVVKFYYVLDWGCAFWTAGDSTNQYNVYHKCSSDLPADGLSATKIPDPSDVLFNKANRSVWFITDSPNQKYFRMAIGETSSAISLPYCDTYNLEIGLCSKCAANTLLLTSGGCSEPVKVAVPSSQFSAKVSGMMLELNINLDLNNYESFITQNTRNDSFLSFSNPDAKKFYAFRVYPSSKELNLYKILRVEMIPKVEHSIDSMSTSLTLLFPNYTQLEGTSKRLLQQAALPGNDLTLPPWVSLSPGQNSSYSTFFNHVYMVAFFLKVYLILVRPFFLKPNTDPRSHWFVHFVLCVQITCILGFNSWDLKGHLGGVMQRAGESCFSYLGWNPVLDLSNGKESLVSGFYFDKFTRSGMIPVFVEELLAFTLIYFGALIAGIVTPVFITQIRSLRQMTMICYLPQVWFMFWIGAFNTFVGKNPSIKNYTSFSFSLILLVLSIVEVVLWIVPAAYPSLESALGFPGVSRIIAFDSEGTNEQQKLDYPLPIWAHVEIFVAIFTGLILGTTQRYPTLQIALLFVGFLVAIPGLLLHFRWALNRRIIRFRVAWAGLLTLMLLFSWILHSKENGLEGVTVLTVLAMICYFLAFGVIFGTLVLRFLQVQFGWGVSLQGAPLLPDPAPANEERNGENSELSNSAKAAASILDRFVNQQEGSRMMNDSRNESVVQIRALDQSVANQNDRESAKLREEANNRILGEADS